MIKDIDVQGAAQIRDRYPGAVFVYVVPPSRADIERRLRGRFTEPEEAIQRRLAAVAFELEQWKAYDYLVINDDLEHAAQDLSALVRAYRLRTAH